MHSNGLIKQNISFYCNQNPQVDHTKAVKEYSGSAADKVNNSITVCII